VEEPAAEPEVSTGDTQALEEPLAPPGSTETWLEPMPAAPTPFAKPGPSVQRTVPPAPSFASVPTPFAAPTPAAEVAVPAPVDVYDTPASWQAANSKATLIADGISGNAVRVSRSAKAEAFAIVARKIVGSKPGARFRAGVYVRSVSPGMYVCLRVEEFTKGRAFPTTSERCRPSTAGWQRLRLRARATAKGGRLVFSIRVLAALGGTSFDVDGFRLES
jgi:hypothetical protein